MLEEIWEILKTDIFSNSSDIFMLLLLLGQSHKLILAKSCICIWSNFSLILYPVLFLPITWNIFWNVNIIVWVKIVLNHLRSYLDHSFLFLFISWLPHCITCWEHIKKKFKMLSCSQGQWLACSLSLLLLFLLFLIWLLSWGSSCTYLLVIFCRLKNLVGTIWWEST